MCFYNLKQNINRQVEEYLEEYMMETTATECGIDERACHKMWKSVDGVVIRASELGRFNYYGGGEYVSKEFVTEAGDYVFYSADDERVAGWLGMDENDDPLDDFNYVGSRHHY
jgi:hypothetical protein